MLAERTPSTGDHDYSQSHPVTAANQPEDDDPDHVLPESDDDSNEEAEPVTTASSTESETQWLVYGYQLLMLIQMVSVIYSSH